MDTPSISPIWKFVSSNANYEVSNDGRVRRVISFYSGKAGHILKPRYDKRGYVSVVLYKDGIGKSELIHCLVAAAFIGERPLGMEVNHKNGIKDDNHLENLEYLSRSANSQHSFDVLGRKTQKGETNGWAKLNEVKVKQIKQMLSQGLSLSFIGKHFNVDKCTISDIKQSRSWKHVE